MSTRSCGDAPPSPISASVTYETLVRSPVSLTKLLKRVINS